MKEEIINQIKTVFEQINLQGKSQDSIGLLESANQLSTLRYNLSDLWIRARENAEILEADYKVKIDKEMLKLRKQGKTIEEAKAKARMNYSVDYYAYIEAESDKNRLAALRDDLSVKISLIQSYASELRSSKNFKEL